MVYGGYYDREEYREESYLEGVLIRFFFFYWRLEGVDFRELGWEGGKEVDFWYMLVFISDYLMLSVC